MVGGQWLTEKECKNPEPFRGRKGSKGSGFLFSVVMQQLLPYSEGEDADDAVPCILERGTGADAACQQSGQSAPDGLLHGLEGELFCEIPGRIFGFTERFFALCVGQKRNVFS